MRINPLTAIDFYKADHRRQYPEGTTKIYSNFTARSDRLANILKDRFDGKIVFFGLQYFLKGFLMIDWEREFFKKDKAFVVARYKRRMDNALGKDAIPMEHIEALHDLGYLPIKIKAVPEGSRIPIKTPVLTITNTHPDFYWLVNYLETILSCMLWKACTSATTAYEYRRLLTEYAEATGTPKEFVNFQAHDFSFRGMSGINDAVLSGAAHLLSFWGTDTVPAIDFLEDYYGADSDKEMIGCSVSATEHSVMCMGSKENEAETFRRLITKLYPKGIVSIVSDTWDFWKVITEYASALKDQIMGREGKVVFRPDSGNPVDIICGTSHNYNTSDSSVNPLSHEYKGAVECLWDIFGGTINEKGYKVLDPHVGLIYGDSITLERAQRILEGLKRKGFASSNIVFGVGSYTYTYVTRDTYGFAVKSTYGEINGVAQEIYKDPVTDSGIKKSAVGLIRVNEDGSYSDKQTDEQENSGLLQTVFEDGKLLVDQNLSDIRNRINQQGD